jgi:UDP-GlcNAc:undecaprenyl-phosphate/decaprenyl-phosphate GlcNAc-1-phosphate transferase
MGQELSSLTKLILCLGAFLTTLGLTPLFIKLARRLGAMDRGGYRKIKSGGTPLMGGLAVAVPFLGACGFVLGHLPETERAGLLVLALSCSAVLVLGVMDDIHCLGARTKFLVQILVALFVCANHCAIRFIEIPFWGLQPLSIEMGWILTVLWLVGLCNAFNLIDGLDGLASGLALISALALTIIATLNGSGLVTLLGLALAGSLLAFLLFNFHPARVFLGDTGSMFLGFALGMIVLMGSYKTQTTTILVGPVLALGVPIFETLISMARRFMRGHPIFSGDQRHTHHRLLRRGLSQPQVALTLYLAALCCAVASVLRNLIPTTSPSAWIPIAVYVTAMLGIAWFAGYLRSLEPNDLFMRRRRNKRLSAFAHYAILSLSDSGALLSMDDVVRMACKELRLDNFKVWCGEEPPDWEKQAPEAEVGPVGEVRLRPPDGPPLVVRYHHHKLVNEQEKQDVAACLAWLFERVRAIVLSEGMAAQTATEYPPTRANGRYRVQLPMRKPEFAHMAGATAGAGANSASGSDGSSRAPAFR